jgi:hypothetical protein
MFALNGYTLRTALANLPLRTFFVFSASDRRAWEAVNRRCMPAEAYGG